MRTKNSGFLLKVKESSCLVSESKILAQLESMKKAVVISTDSLEKIQSKWTAIKDEIERLHQSKIFHIDISYAGIQVSEIGERQISDSAFLNIVQEKFSEYNGYCFVVNSGIKYLLYGGKIDENVETCLQKTRSMQEKLNLLQPVSKLPQVFEHFMTSCTYNKEYYDNYFDAESGKIKAEVKEQELRNLLLDFLNSIMQGDVQTEFCTDYINDEESVDIYVNDGTERAIIEVKFSLPKRFYLGATHHNLSKRVKVGLQQLDKYALHLSKDSRQVDYGYVYMFYMSKDTEESVMQEVEQIIKQAKEELTSEFLSIFKDVILNNMKKWGSKN